MSAEKYHLSPKTGRPNACRATKRPCPIGGAVAHYSSREVAQRAYEMSQETFGAKPKLEKNVEWYEKPLSAKEVREQEARNEKMLAGVGLTEAEYNAHARNNTRLRYGGTHDKLAEVTPVPTERELNDTINELREDLYGNDLRELMSWRGVTQYEVQAAEEKGESITLKVPSYYEVNISTDLARYVLGMPPRPQTRADRTELRRTQLALQELRAKFMGRIISHEEAIEFHKAERELMDQERELQQEARVARAIERAPRSVIEGKNGLFWAMGDGRGGHLGTFRPVENGFAASTWRFASGLEKEWHSLGTFPTKEAAMRGILIEGKHTFYG